MVLKTRVKLGVTEPGFLGKKTVFSPEIGKISQKQGFLSLMKNLVIRY